MLPTSTYILQVLFVYKIKFTIKHQVFADHKGINANLNNRFNILIIFHDLNIVIKLLKTLLPFFVK